MKAKLNFRSRRTIIITSIIAILAIIALIGVYVFVKSDRTARAVDKKQNSLEVQGAETNQSQDAQNDNNSDNNNDSESDTTTTTTEETLNENQAQTTTNEITSNENVANGTTAINGTVDTSAIGTTGAVGVTTNNIDNGINSIVTDSTVTTETVYDNVVTEEPWESHSVAWKPETPQFISPDVNTAGENNKDVKTQVIVIKKWKDSDVTKQYRPEVTFNLYNEADQTKSVRENVGLNENSQAVFTDLPKYDDAGSEIKYIVKENGEANGHIEGNTGVIYEVEYSGENGILTVTNKIDYTSVKTEITGTKTWVDGGKTHDNSQEVKLTLTRTVTKGETTTEPETVNATPTWNGNTYTYSGLEKYDAEGYEYSYSISEAKVNGYNEPVQDENNFTNTIFDPNNVTITGTKTWIDGGKTHDNSKDVKLILTRTSARAGSQGEKVNVIPTWNGSTYTYSGLEKYDTEGYKYTYKVTEAPVDGYTTKYDNYNITNTKNLMLYKKAVDKSGNEIKKLIYKENNEENNKENNKFNYVLTVVSQQTMKDKQKVTDELPKEIKIDNWKIPNNVTVTTDSKDDNRQIVEWTVDLLDENNLTQELTIPVKAEKTLFNEYLKEETTANRTIIDDTFATGGDTNISSTLPDSNNQNVNIFLRTLNTAEATNNQGYIYAGTVTATNLAKTDQKDAYARKYDNNGEYINQNYNDDTVNNILISKNNESIENMLNDFSRDNADAENGLGKFIVGGLPSETLVNENLKKLYDDKVQLTKSQIILWYKVPATRDASRKRHYTIKNKAGNEIFNGDVPLNECNYHIDGLIIDINYNKYIPLGTKVSVVNTAKLGDMSATATLDIYYEIESDSRAKANDDIGVVSIDDNTVDNELEQETSNPQAEQNQAKETTIEEETTAITKDDEQKNNIEDKTQNTEAEQTEPTETTKDTKTPTENTENVETKTKDSAETTENTVKEETKNTEINQNDNAEIENEAEPTETETGNKQENNII